MGIYATFVRLAGCNMNCVWCDTKQIMMEQATETTFDQLDTIIQDSGTHHVIFTGGEPLLQQDDMFTFMKEYGPRWFYIETNGICKVKPEDAALAHITISPKLLSAFDPSIISSVDELFDSKYSPLNIVKNWLHTSGNIEFKFVIGSNADLESVRRIINDLPKGLSYIPIILQAVGPSKNAPFSHILDPMMNLYEKSKDILGSYKNIKIGIQLHKLINIQ